jgi:NADH:ubiquinone reductase (H+-translocating)
METLRPKVVIIGGGFGGLNVALGLRHTSADITLIDRTNHHLFQPLLYQVATATLSPRDVAVPIRSILRKQHNTRVYMGDVTHIDKEKKVITLSDKSIFKYDYLIIAAGSRHTYFGHAEWEEVAPGLKTIRDAVRIREHILMSLEISERYSDPELQKPYLTYVIVGGGPTGVEMAGAIAEIVRRSIQDEFQSFSTSQTRIILVEGGPRILTPYPESLSEKAKQSLEDLGVDVRLKSIVTNVTKDGLQVGEEWIASKNIIWAAGNVAAPILKTLDVPLDRMGHVIINKHLEVPDTDGIYAIGDCAACLDSTGKQLPGIAPVAVQQGRYLANTLRRKINNEAPQKQPFKYIDKGMMATIGYARAVAYISGLPFSGLFAWVLWSLIHVTFLIGFRNKIVVMLEWAWNLLTSKRSVRLIANITPQGEPYDT